MIKNLILFILLSLGSVTATFAIPSVIDVEKTISSGDYDKAKKELEEVLKVHPNSLVANSYMLEVLKIEYAGSLVPSVSYKLYENKINEIKNNLELERLKQIEAQKEKAKQEFWATLKKVAIFFSLFVLLFLICLKLSSIYRLKKQKELQEKLVLEKEREEEEWVKKSIRITNELDVILSKHMENLEVIKSNYHPYVARDLNNLYLDNQDFCEVLKNRDYGDRNSIDRHINNCWSFLDKSGINK